MSDIEFAEGLYYKEPVENAPDFVKGKLSVSKDKFSRWLEATEANDKGYINLDIKISQGGKPYIAVDKWVPQERKEDQNQQAPQQNGQLVDHDTGTAAADDIPF